MASNAVIPATRPSVTLDDQAPQNLTDDIVSSRVTLANYRGGDFLGLSWIVTALLARVLKRQIAVIPAFTLPMGVMQLLC
jgi:hypothetical protein